MGCESSPQFLPTPEEVEQALGARVGVILTRIDNGLAKTTGLGSTTIATSPDQWRITSEGTPAVNDDMERVGQTNGWDTGTVDQTCEDVGDSSRVILCATIVSNFAGSGGDSGAPVFEITSGSDVALMGVYFGHNGTDGFFSSVGNVYGDLGPSVSWDSCYSGC